MGCAGEDGVVRITFSTLGFAAAPTPFQEEEEEEVVVLVVVVKTNGA